MRRRKMGGRRRKRGLWRSCRYQMLSSLAEKERGPLGTGGDVHAYEGVRGISGVTVEKNLGWHIS